MSSVPISVYIIAKNEAARIGRAVSSVVKWADEVIVVDSGSSDDTVQIAEALGARVLNREWDGYGPQKRFAEDQCRNRWLLNIDADEEVSESLARQIELAVDEAAPDKAAFRIRVTDVLPGETGPQWHAYSRRILRLYNRDFGRMSDHPYKDRIELHCGTTSSLSGKIYHRSFISWQATLQKINFYTTQVAEERAASGKRSLNSLRLWTEFPLIFLKVWIGRRYILRGSIGLAMSISVAYLNLMRLLKTEEVLKNRLPTQSTSAAISSKDAV